MTEAVFLIVAHAPLAHALRESVLHVMPEVAPDLVSVDVTADMSQSQVLAKMAQSLYEVLHAKGLKEPVAKVLICSDILGATPNNAACTLLKEMQEAIEANTSHEAMSSKSSTSYEKDTQKALDNLKYCLQKFSKFEVALVVGINVPALWRAVHYRAKNLDDLVQRCIEGGKQGMVSL